MQDKIMDLIFNKALYARVTIGAEDADLLHKYFKGEPNIPVRAYCKTCKSESIFKLDKCEYRHGAKVSTNVPFGFLTGVSYVNRGNEEVVQSFANKVYTLAFFCEMDSTPLMYTLFFDGKELIKIGQYPSIADLGFPTLDKYEKPLGDEYDNLKRAVGLKAHGIGIGSFVYLRRIIEKLVYDKYELHKDHLPISEKEFANLEFKKKIVNLSPYLPEFLVKNKDIYSIISEGIHELTEQRCLDFFDVIEKSIELILDQKIEEDNKNKQKKELSNALNAINATTKH